LMMHISALRFADCLAYFVYLFIDLLQAEEESPPGAQLGVSNSLFIFFYRFHKLPSCKLPPVADAPL
ncbi:MAG TPA: hypothetical protein VK206_25325, partial [Anaerolineales bacterium]|nr:hypothetical protein [Anaerolineales bacterium]